MSSTLPSLRLRFLRIFMNIAAFTTFLISVGISSDEYVSQRHTQIENIQQIASTASHIYILASTHHKAAQIDDYMASFADDSRLVRLCIYDADNRLISFWQRSDDDHCPQFMAKTGMSTDAHFVHIALPMKRSGKYAGMVYA